MEYLQNYLSSIRGAIFKLLPMKEDTMNGIENHLDDYIDSLIVNLIGAMQTFPNLRVEKQYLYVINNIQYIKHFPVEFKSWRKIILDSTQSIDNLYSLCGGERCKMMK